MYNFALSLLKLLPPETAHSFTINILKYSSKNKTIIDDPILSQHLMGLDFTNPLGLAAGFDKNAQVINSMFNFGFGFVEIGTVTPKIQRGNNRPRVFRLKNDEAIINHLGFNNIGSDKIYKNLKKVRKTLYENKIIGVNIGKNRDSINSIDIEEETKSIRLPKFSVPHSHKTLLEIKEANIGYTKPLLENISLQVKKHQKIAIIGANGIGKSTLLACLYAKKNLLAGSVNISQATQLAFFSQDIISQFDKNVSLLDCLMTHTNIGQAEARSILGGLLFSNNTVQKPLKVLSGGELNRLGLAYVLAKKPNLLFLDEPTNHLDIKSSQVLTQYLKDYKGTLVFVSHNRRFIDDLATHVLACSKHHRTEIIEGNLEDYKNYCMQHKLQSVLEENIVKKVSGTKKSTKSYSEQKQKKKNIEAIKRQIKKTEEKLEKLAVEEKELEKKLQDLVTKKDFTKVIEAQKAMSSINKKINSLESDLLDLLEQDDK